MSTQLTDDELTTFIPERLMSEWQASRTHPNCKWDADAVVDFFRELALSRAENARLQERVEEAERRVKPFLKRLIEATKPYHENEDEPKAAETLFDVYEDAVMLRAAIEEGT